MATTVRRPRAPTSECTAAPSASPARIRDGRRLPLKRKLLFACAVAVATYVVAEVVATGLYMAGAIPDPLSYSIAEDRGRTWAFDPVRGWIAPRHAWRRARITHGVVEWIGEAKGNNQGFIDRDDFGPSRVVPGRPRFAVLGDSFSDAPYLSQNWPDFAEDIARTEGRPIELLNFSQAGAGVANWWSIVTRLIEPQEYELDAVIFAVYTADLHRKFMVCHDDGGECTLAGRVSSWDPATYPTTLEEARRWLKPQGSSRLSPDEFDAALARRVPPSRIYIASLVQEFCGKVAAFCKRKDRSEARQQLYVDIRRSLARQRLPIIVVHIPNRGSLLEGPDAAGPPPDTVQFAEILGAPLIDGSRAFAGLDVDQIRELWLPFDGHWGQGGSDRFARFMDKQLAEWWRQQGASAASNNDVQRPHLADAGR